MTATATSPQFTIPQAAPDYHALNAMLNLYDDNGRIRFDADHQAVDAYMQDQVEPRTMRFASTRERLAYLLDQGY